MYEETLRSENKADVSQLVDWLLGAPLSTDESDALRAFRFLLMASERSLTDAVGYLKKEGERSIQIE